jgi:hypothetical protein
MGFCHGGDWQSNPLMALVNSIFSNESANLGNHNISQDLSQAPHMLKYMEMIKGIRQSKGDEAWKFYDDQFVGDVVLYRICMHVYMGRGWLHICVVG